MPAVFLPSPPPRAGAAPASPEERAAPRRDTEKVAQLMVQKAALERQLTMLRSDKTQIEGAIARNDGMIARMAPSHFLRQRAETDTERRRADLRTVAQNMFAAELKLRDVIEKIDAETRLD